MQADKRTHLRAKGQVTESIVFRETDKQAVRQRENTHKQAIRKKKTKQRRTEGRQKGGGKGE